MRHLFLVGHNVAETQTVLWARMLDRLEGPSPPRLVLVDPRRTAVATRADVHLPIRPGTNVALLNAILHELTGELAFHYCHVPQGQPLSLSRLIRAAGLRWPAEENFQFGKGCFGLDQSQVRLYTAIARHTVLVMAALAICAITAALLRRRTSTQARPPARPDQPPPAEPGMIPLTVPEAGRLLTHPPPPGAAGHWLDWRRRHQARSAWYHQRTRLIRDEIALVS